MIWIVSWVMSNHDLLKKSWHNFMINCVRYDMTMLVYQFESKYDMNTRLYMEIFDLWYDSNRNWLLATADMKHVVSSRFKNDKVLQLHSVWAMPVLTAREPSSTQLQRKRRFCSLSVLKSQLALFLRPFATPCKSDTILQAFVKT